MADIKYFHPSTRLHALKSNGVTYVYKCFCFMHQAQSKRYIQIAKGAVVEVGFGHVKRVKEVNPK